MRVLNLSGDHVAPAELRVLEQVAHEPLGGRCWMSISSTFSPVISGLSEARQSETNASKALRKSRFFL